MAGFGALSEAEQEYRLAGRLKASERLTCQCTLQTNAAGRVPEQTKFPHQAYSE
jgi:2Fe-2S ferredoxin